MKEFLNAELDKWLPNPTPVGFEGFATDGSSYAYRCKSLTNSLNGILVLVSVSVEDDGRTWIHLSFSRRGRTPSYEDTLAVKRAFIGDERYAYQVFPPQKDYYSSPGAELTGRAQNVLHLWAPAEGSILPDFLKARGGML